MLIVGLLTNDYIFVGEDTNEEQTPMFKPDKHLHYLLIGIAGILIFLPGIFSSFNSDDFVWLRNSQRISFESISHFAVNYNPVLKFRPFTHLIFQVLYTIFRLDPVGYHLTTLFLHIINALIFYALLLKFTSESKISLFASLIFVSHFAQEETILWISALSSPLVTFFYLCSIWCLWKCLEKQKLGFYLLSFILSTLALLSKEDGTTIFLVVFLLTALKSSGGLTSKIKRGILLSSPFFGLTALYSIIRYLTVPEAIMSKFLTLNPVVVIKNLCYFGISFLFPVRLFFDLVGFKVHSYLNNIIQFRLNNSWIILIVSVISLVFLSLIIHFLRKRIPGFKLGLVMLLIGILPYLLVNGNGQRFLYFSCLGFSLALASLLIFFLERVNKLRFLNLLITGILIFNGLVLYERAVWWRKAGKVCQEVIHQTGKIIILSPRDSEIYFANLPQRINGAYTFHIGFEEAISIFYPESRVKVYDLGQLKDDELEALRGKYKGKIFIFDGKRFAKL
jgi:hypothetical protein